MSDINHQDGEGKTKLQRAAWDGHYEEVTRLLERDIAGWTCVMEAAYRGHGDIVQSLHQAGADINTRSNDGATAVMWAAYRGHGDIVKYLHQAGAHINISKNG